MANDNEGTASGASEVPSTAEGVETPGATGTPNSPDEVTTLRSRNAGLDAKVTSLSKSYKEALDRADAAERRAQELAEGKDNGDAELRALIQRKDDELKAARQESALTRIQANFPETYAVLGESAASLSADQLAAAEVRFRGVTEPEPVDPPRPVGNNPSRTGGAASPPPKTEMTADDLEAHLRSLPVPWATVE